MEQHRVRRLDQASFELMYSQLKDQNKDLQRSFDEVKMQLESQSKFMMGGFIIFGVLILLVAVTISIALCCQ